MPAARPGQAFIPSGGHPAARPAGPGAGDRTPLLVGIVITAVVLLAILIMLLVQRSGSDSSAPSPDGSEGEVAAVVIPEPGSDDLHQTVH